MDLVGEKQNIEGEKDEHGEEIAETGADNSLRSDEKAGGQEGEKGDEEKDDELASSVAHGGE